MLKIRLIPMLLLKEGRMIKTKQFHSFRDVGNPKTVAKVYNAQKADELIFLDISATDEKRGFLLEVIRSVAEECLIPITAGGGVRNMEQARELLQSGADKVSINTAAIEDPSFIKKLSEKFGKSTVVVSIDYKKNDNGQNEVFVCRGKKSTGFDPVSWARKVEELGAGEILLTSIDKEGMMMGYDLETIKLVSEAVSIPVIASGGAGTVQDLVDSIEIGRASAVAAASIFHFTDQSIIKGHSFMRSAGLSVRI
ncbi:MAG: imidazole glycerol phosphate synthase subunit HisF [Candidatus Yanofskybacteria bacterium]|nr:imidazole glycerol phosphate synthase subunit HisF [Candidatus Yanofskybacteria bacterium]